VHVQLVADAIAASSAAVWGAGHPAARTVLTAVSAFTADHLHPLFLERGASPWQRIGAR